MTEFVYDGKYVRNYAQRILYIVEGDPLSRTEWMALLAILAENMQ